MDLAGFIGGYNYCKAQEVAASQPEEQVWTIQAVVAKFEDISPTEQHLARSALDAGQNCALASAARLWMSPTCFAMD